MNNSQNTSWSSKLGFVLAATGSAVGLGNIWRLPYLVAQHGGGTFLTIYIFFCLMMGLLILLGEFTLGKHLGSSLNDSLIKKVKFGKFFSNTTYIFLLISLALSSFYFVVSGWTITYLFKSLFAMIDYSPNTQGSYYDSVLGNILSSPLQLIIPAIIFILITVFINYKGVVEGVERVNLYMLPTLFIMLIIMIVKVLSLDGASKGVSYLFSFDSAYINKKMILDALGQAFFSLSLGMGVMIVFSSYVKPNYNLASSALSTVALGVGIGVFSCLMIIPAVFAFSLDINSGPTLTFITLPTIFSQLPFGMFFAVIFFSMMAFAALTSTISIVETGIPFLSRLFKIGRNASLIMFTAIVILLVIPQALSFNVLSFVKIAGLNTFDLANNLVNIFIMINSIILCVLLGFAIQKDILKKELTNNGTIKFPMFNVWHASIRYVVPIVVIIIMIY